MKVAVIEDNELDQKFLVSKLVGLGHTVSHVYSSFNEANKEIADVDIDLIVTDYLLENGKTAKDILNIKGLNNRIKIIVCTNFYEQSVYDELIFTRPFFFMDKEFSDLDLLQAINYLEKSVPKPNKSIKTVEDIFFIKNGDSYKSINALCVYYFEVEGKYINIILKDRKYAIRSTLTDLEVRLSNDFIRVHSAYIVNRNKIISFKLSSSEILLQDGLVLPLSRNYKKVLIDAIVIA